MLDEECTGSLNMQSFQKRSFKMPFCREGVEPQTITKSWSKFYKFMTQPSKRWTRYLACTKKAAGRRLTHASYSAVPIGLVVNSWPTAAWCPAVIAPHHGGLTQMIIGSITPTNPKYSLYLDHTWCKAERRKWLKLGSNSVIWTHGTPGSRTTPMDLSPKCNLT